MMRIIPAITIIFAILIFSTYANSSSQVVPPYNEWLFAANADYSNHTFNDTWVSIKLKNGMIILQTNLKSSIKSGTEIQLRVVGDASPSSVYAGLKVIVNNDTLLDRKISHCDTTYRFYALRDYHTGDHIKILVYDIGGNMTIHLNKLIFEFSKGGISNGVFLAGIGITVVFTVLGILALIMYLQKYFVKPRDMTVDGEKGKTKNKEDEIIAAIAAAIRMYLEGKRFKIISVKPSPWKHYGRIARMRRLK